MTSPTNDDDERGASQLCPVDAAGPVTLAFTLAEPVPAGAFLRLLPDGVRTLISFVIEGAVIAGEAAPLASRFEPKRLATDWPSLVRSLDAATVRAPRDLPPGERVAFSGPTRPTDAPTGLPAPGGRPAAERNPFAGLLYRFRLVASADPGAPPEAWRPVGGAPVTLVTSPGAPARLEAYRLHDGRLAVQHYDAQGNPAPVSGADAKIRVEGDAGLVREPASRATVIESHKTEDRVRVTDGSGRRALSTPPARALDGAPIFFGDFHWHCDYSGDGQRPLADAMASARDELCLDFCGPADHLNWKDSYGTKTVEDQTAACHPFDVPGRFVSLPTFELSGREGHANVIADSWELLGEIARRVGERVGYPSNGRYPLHELAALCPPGRALLVPHHTNMDSAVREGAFRPDGRPAWARFDWGPVPETAATRLMEIHQNRGSMEAEEPDPYWRIDAGGFGSSTRTALARGFWVGFTGGTDNHCGWPSRNADGWNGLTGVAADALDLPSLFRALHARRCYATTGVRIAADWEMVGSESGRFPMGADAPLQPGERRTFRVLLRSGTNAPWERVQIVSCGAVLADLPVPPGALDFAAEWEDARPGRPLRDCYYYVRARQADGHCAWLSPIFIDLAEGGAA